MAASACTVPGPPKRVPRIVIVTYKSHEVLDAVVRSTVEWLVNEGNVPRDHIDIFNPNGQLREIQTYVRTKNSESTDLIIAVSTPASQAVLSARHPNVPVLYSFVSNPAALQLGSGPGAVPNVTGISNVLDYEEGFNLLDRVLPNVRILGVIYDPSEANSAYSFDQISREAGRRNKQVVARPFGQPSELQATAAALPGVDVIYVGGDNTLVANLPLVLSVTNGRRLPVFASDEGSVRVGAVAAFSIDYSDFGRESGRLAAQVLAAGDASKVSPVAYRRGRCVVNPAALALVGARFNYQAAGCVVLP
jgi:putative ABC transport system substrate-binding protein